MTSYPASAEFLVLPKALNLHRCRLASLLFCKKFCRISTPLFCHIIHITSPVQLHKLRVSHYCSRFAQIRWSRMNSALYRDDRETYNKLSWHGGKGMYFPRRDTEGETWVEKAYAEYMATMRISQGMHGYVVRILFLSFLI